MHAVVRQHDSISVQWKTTGRGNEQLLYSPKRHHHSTKGTDMEQSIRISLVLTCAAIIAGGCGTQSACPDGYISLFNGNDLTGWERHMGLPDSDIGGKWVVEDGAIVGVQDPPGRGGFLSNKTEYQDFELTLETKIDYPFDSGVFLRVGPDGKSHQVTLDWEPDGHIGNIYCPWTQAGVYNNQQAGMKQFKADDWNAIKIRIEGEPARIQAWVNGVQVTNFQHTAETTKGIPTKGAICLQVHPSKPGYYAGKARFRNICVREL
jgi:hypothetical protein